MKKKKMKIVYSTAILLILIIAAYLGIGFYFSNHFYFGTTINGIDVSGKSLGQAEELFAEKVEDAALAVINRSGNAEYIFPADYGRTYVYNGSAEEYLKGQNAFLWLFQLTKEKNYTLEDSLVYDEDKLREKIASLDLMNKENQIEPADAYLTLEEGRYIIKDEVQGNSFDTEAAKQLIFEAAVKGQERIDLNDYPIYNSPSITAKDDGLMKKQSALNSYLDIKIIHQFGSTEEVLSGEKINEWITIDENYNVTVNRDAVFLYVESLAIKYNTVSITRTIQSSHGYSVDIQGGDYGWAIDKDAETDAVVQLIIDGTSETREPIYQTGRTAVTHDGVDTGNPDTYVEIDIEGQYLWFYKNGTLIVESPVVTGMKGTDNATRKGTFSVMFKEENYTLVGEDYNTPVAYFIPFYTNVGLHDANWQSTFGGNRYETNGSHGCVNMPYDKVQAIYSQIEVGTIVYCY